jgi:hypothetical protein
MYRQKEVKKVTIEEFGLTEQGKLAADNRWVMLAEIIPLLWGLLILQNVSQSDRPG